MNFTNVFRSARVWPVALLAVALAMSCSGVAGGQAPPEATSTTSGTVSSASSPTASAQRTPVTSTTVPATGLDTVEDEADALQAVTQFVVDTQLASFSAMRVFSSDFTEELFANVEDLSADDYESLLERWNTIEASEKRTLAAFQMLDDLSTAYYSDGEVERPAGHAAPASGVWSGLYDSATAFFGWIAGSGERDRQRVSGIASHMTPAQQNQLYSEWRSLNPNTSIEAADGRDFFRRLDSGEFDSRAGRIHTNLLSIAASSIDAPHYSYIAQDQDLLMGQVIVDEGSEGVSRGAEFAIDASFAALGGNFPDLQRGRELADEANEWVEYVEDTYEDPLGAIKDKIVDKIKERTTGRLGEYLDERLNERVGEDLAERIGSLADLATGFSKPSDVIDAAGDYGIARLEDLGTSIVAAIREGEDGEGPHLVLRVRETGQEIKLPPGIFSIQSFDSSGRSVSRLLADIVPGWETIARDALQAGDSGSGSTSTGNSDDVETTERWVQAEVRLNPKEWPLRNERDDDRFRGTYSAWSVEDGHLTQEGRLVERDQLIREDRFEFTFDAPPAAIEPGETVTLSAEGEGFVNGPGFPGGQFEYRADGVGLQGEGYMSLDRDVLSGSVEVMFTAPNASRGEFTIHAFLWNCAACLVDYVYRVEEVVPPRRGLSRQDCDSLPGDTAALAVCQRAVEVADVNYAVATSDVANCDDAQSLGDLLTCDLLQSVQAGDLTACLGYDEDTQALCAAAISTSSGRADRLDLFSEMTIATHVALTGDLQALRGIKDPGRHDIAVMSYLALLRDNIASGKDSGRVPPANFCDQLSSSADSLMRDRCGELTELVRTGHQGYQP